MFGKIAVYCFRFAERLLGYFKLSWGLEAYGRQLANDISGAIKTLVYETAREADSYRVQL
jgi:hypothetical protein